MVQEENNEDHIGEFINAQREMNDITLTFIEGAKTRRDENNKRQDDMESKLDKLLAAMTPPAKRQKKGPDDGSGCSKTPLNDDFEDTISQIEKDSLTEGEISIHVEDDERIDAEDELWEQLSKNQNKGKGSSDIPGTDSCYEQDALDDDEMEAILGSKYQDLLDQTEEKLGEPITSELATICQKTWGHTRLEKDKKKELWKGNDVPSNCTSLKAPKLNAKVYVKLAEHVQSKDRGLQDRQKAMSKAATPVLYGMGHIDTAEAAIARQKKYAPLAPPAPTTDLQKADAKKLCDSLDKSKKIISAMEKQAKIADTAMQALRKQLTQTVKILNYSFTETSRKRRYDLTAALGPSFKAYAHEEASDGSAEKTEFLFTEATMKKMNKDLATVKTGGGSKSQNNNFSKNGSSSGKTQRSGNNYQGNNYNPNYGNQKKSYNGSNSYNNSNNSQNYNSKFKGKKHNNNKN